MSVDIIYETHSISEDNERGIATGWLDGRLSEHGRQLAVKLGERRRKDGIRVVLTSDLGRAVETAEIAFAGSEIPIITDVRLRECNYGDWNGAPVALIHSERLRRIDEPFPEGESYRQVTQRTASFLADLLRDYDGARVLIIGHSATRWSLEYLINRTPLEELVNAPFQWQEGWSYTLPTAWSEDEK